MSKGYCYILLCANEKYYTGSTNDIDRRLKEHQSGNGANFTKNNLPVQLVYCQEFERVEQAFRREKQIQGWSRAKKEAMIRSDFNELHKLAECKNETHFKNRKFGSI